MRSSRIRHTAAAIFACATVAAVVGIATGAAAPSKNGNSNTNGDSSRPPEFGMAIGPPPPGATFRTFGRNGNGKSTEVVIGGPGDVGGAAAFGGPPVHSEMVVPNKAGDDFITVTQDNGKVNSVSGSQLTITEGTDNATYKTVTLDIPSDATLVRDGDKAQLSDLQAGDQVHVSQSPDGSFVFATDSQFQQKMLKQFREHFKNLPRPRPGIAGGFPPGLPPPPMAWRGH